MSQRSKLTATVTAVAFVLAGQAASADMVTSIGQGEGEVSIVAWPGYIERGESDPAYDWVTGFEKETGCKVTVKTAGSSDEMVSLMNAGGFDLVTASGDASLRLIAGKTVQEINISLIKDWSKIDPNLQSAVWHTVGGKHYGVPWQWGANVLMYNADVFENAPQSWSVVFEEQMLPDGKSNKGRVQAYYGPIYVADAALYLKTNNPSLGITDPYALTKPQFDAAIDLLRQQRKIVNKYWGDAAAQVDDFTSEGVVASTSWPYQVNTLRDAGKIKIGSTIPKEGATGWADTTMMHAQAPHPNCAYMWLNHSLSNNAQAGTAAWFGSVPAVPAACQDPILTEQGCKTNGIQNFKRIYFWKTPVRDCGGGRECVSYRDWVAAYQAVQSGS
ncbi:ABC transporter substrate-binding protein [Dongia deserti]|uniref:ABC transporter substrate-binding protein n=1 Tax=Dongia deserti TaxID=2268030 RepID=UPI000E651834|nr:ABC transporter substrate-binding protein [Dongia deserti]